LSRQVTVSDDLSSTGSFTPRYLYVFSVTTGFFLRLRYAARGVIGDMRLTPFYFLLALLAGCSSSLPYVPETQPLDRGRLPMPDVALTIPNLGSCTDSSDHTLRLNSSSPVTVLVHGCNGSAGRFRSLAQLYAFYGQQAVCFSYNDRDSLVDSSKLLITAINKLASLTSNKNISVIGHSMGGLVARKAMEVHSGKSLEKNVKITLATVSAPLAGIDAAKACGSKTLHWLSLGFIPLSCWGVTGDNWYEITSASDFIRRPGPLLPSVQRYLKVVTNEKNTCRRKDKDGRCVKSDYVFDLAEQYQPVIDSYSQVTNVQVDAGHVEIVGYKHMAPRKLLAILQQQGMMPPTPPEQKAALENLLANLY